MAHASGTNKALQRLAGCSFHVASISSRGPSPSVSGCTEHMRKVRGVFRCHCAVRLCLLTPALQSLHEGGRSERGREGENGRKKESGYFWTEVGQPLGLARFHVAQPRLRRETAPGYTCLSNPPPYQNHRASRRPNVYNILATHTHNYI